MANVRQDVSKPKLSAEGGDPSTKSGAALNAANREHLKAIAQHAKAMGDSATDILTRTSQMMPSDQESEAEQYPAESGERETKAVDLVYLGGEVKALGNGKVGGYLVKFTQPGDYDLTGDRFANSTDFGNATTSPILYHHGMDVKFGTRTLGTGEMKRDDVGVWIEAQLEMRDEYEKAVYEMASAGKLGWSSGTAGHLVERKPEGKGNVITKWPLGLDASLTPTPAEPRNTATSIKSLVTSTGAEAAEPAHGGSISQEQKSMSEVTLSEEKLQQYISAAAAEAVKAYQKAQPAPDTAGVTVVKDEADRPFKSLAEMAKAVKTATVTAKNGRAIVDPRLSRIEFQEREAMKAAQGANESIPADAGYLVEPTISTDLIKPIHQDGVLSSKVRRLPVGSNSNFGYINGVDETSRATGSRWGGVQGYRLAEAATITSSRPKFRRINWELKKFAALMYATDELIMDAAQFNAIASQSAGEELAFMVNDDIYRGLGTGGPQGALQSGALISLARVDASKVQHQDILNMWQRMLPRNRANAAWYINSEVEPQLDALYFTGTTSVLSPYIGYTPEGVMTIKGKPVIVNEFSSALGTAGDILLADFSDYLFWDKGDVQAATSIHIAFLTDEQAFRFVYRCDGQTAWASAITPYKGTNTQSAFVTLLATS